MLDMHKQFLFQSNSYYQIPCIHMKIVYARMARHISRHEESVNAVPEKHQTLQIIKRVI